MQESFQKCFKKAIESSNYKSNLPCNKPIEFEECVDYCEWHENFVQNRNLQDFLTMMKYGMPQRKWISQPKSDIEQKLAAKLFGEANLKNELKDSQSPLPFSILCEKKDYEKDREFYGENVGWPEPACNDFFPTPTDQGMCMSANLNIREIVHNHEEYDSLLESQFQKSPSKIQGDTLWSQKTYVISTLGDPLIPVNPSA